MKPDRRYFLLFKMTKIASADDYTVYQINVEQNQEQRKSEKDNFFARFIKNVGEKQDSDKEMNYINSIRQVFKLMLLISSFLMGDRLSEHQFEIL